METEATIAALATPPGRGAVAILRVSGPEVRAVAARVFSRAAHLRDRVATLGTIRAADGRAIDRGLALFMAGPNSYTGEDTLELHVHGSPIVARETLGALLAAGARLAGPGEFTRRAYLAGKLDLDQAEAVADLIEAESLSAARAATARLAGVLGDAVDAVREDLRAVLEPLAGNLDFPDEVPEPSRAELLAVIARVDERLAALAASAEVGRLVRDGITVAIAGPPNAGKSSLLNALLGEDRALVSEIAGTTRDTIEERIAIDGVLVRLIDTAGLRETPERLEAAGIARARTALAGARVVLVVVDGSLPLESDAHAVLEQTRGRDRVVLFNKSDLGRVGYQERSVAEHGALSGNVHDPQTLEQIRRAIARAGWGGERPDLERPALASARHLDRVNAARDALAEARAVVAQGEALDLAALALVRADAALGELSGIGASEAVLDGVFARFCIGK